VNYIPYQHKLYFTNPQSLNDFIRKGYLDKNFNMLTDSFLYPKTLKIDRFEINMQLRIKEVKRENHEIVLIAETIKDPNDKARAALYDGFYLLAEALAGKRGPDTKMEADAYLHEVYELYPTLFSQLFPELQKYHLERATEEYQNCLRS
jgi:hypothetical protein